MPNVRDKRRSRVREIFCRSCINAAKLFPLNNIFRFGSFVRRLSEKNFECVKMSVVVWTEAFCCVSEVESASDLESAIEYWLYSGTDVSGNVGEPSQAEGEKTNANWCTRTWIENKKENVFHSFVQRERTSVLQVNYYSFKRWLKSTFVRKTHFACFAPRLTNWKCPTFINADCQRDLWNTDSYSLTRMMMRIRRWINVQRIHFRSWTFVRFVRTEILQSTAVRRRVFQRWIVRIDRRRGNERSVQRNLRWCRALSPVVLLLRHWEMLLRSRGVR